ncbi:MAG: acyl carrier protein [Clostridia bacterium]|nr:acyl carrier protein [Clostridia bacterium]
MTERNLKMFEKFKKMLVDELQVDPDKITMEAELANDLGINSIELAELVMHCEEDFEISIQDDDIHNFVTVGDIVNYLEGKSK